MQRDFLAVKLRLHLVCRFNNQFSITIVEGSSSPTVTAKEAEEEADEETQWSVHREGGAVRRNRHRQPVAAGGWVVGPTVGLSAKYRTDRRQINISRWPVNRSSDRRNEWIRGWAGK